MPKLYRISGQACVRALERIGFVQVRQRGSHVVMKKSTLHGEIGCSVPLHREIAICTLRGILKPGYHLKSFLSYCEMRGMK